jgi:hypothetical protein
MTVSADSITAAQRIKLDRKPEDGNMEEAALLQELKDRGYSWKGYGEKGSWNGSKETVDIWKDSAFRARVKKNVTGLSFYNPDGNKVVMNEYITNCEAFDPSELDDDLSSIGASNMAPSAPATPSKPAGSSQAGSYKRQRQ